MADFVKITNTGWYIGASTDTKPTVVPSGSTCYEHNTGKLYITYNGGTNWVEKPSEDGVVDALGGTTDAAASATVDEDATARTGIGLWKGIKNLLIDLKGLLSGGLPAALGAGGGLKVDGSGTALPISGSVTASGTVTSNQGTAHATERWLADSKPFSPILEGGLTEIIDKDDTEVSQNDYSKSVALALGATYSGRIKQISVYATELGTGAVRANSGYLLIFDADPTVTAGDTALALADWQSCIAKVLITDWISDTGGGMATMEVDIHFHAVANLYFVFQNLGTAFNDAAGDDEELHFNTWIKRES